MATKMPHVDDRITWGVSRLFVQNYIRFIVSQEDASRWLSFSSSTAPQHPNSVNRYENNHSALCMHPGCGTRKVAPFVGMGNRLARKCIHLPWNIPEYRDLLDSDFGRWPAAPVLRVSSVGNRPATIGLKEVEVQNSIRPFGVPNEAFHKVLGSDRETRGDPGIPP
jgi:hypothetical protein